MNIKDQIEAVKVKLLIVGKLAIDRCYCVILRDTKRLPSDVVAYIYVIT